MADENLERITILLQAKDKDFARAMDRNNKVIARLSRDASRNTTGMARTVDANLTKISKSATAMGKTFIAGIAAGAITASLDMVLSNIGRTVNGIAQIGNEAKRSGLGVEEFQEWSYVADQNRISVDSLVDGFKELNLRVDEFTVTGVGPAAEALQRLGYTSDELKEKIKKPSDLMLEMLGRMDGLDKAAQIRISDELFGGTAGERFVELLGQGQVALTDTIARAHEVGAVLDDEMIKKADQIDRQWAALSVKMQGYAKKAAMGWAEVLSDMGTTTLDDIFPNDALAKSMLGSDAFAKFSEIGDLRDDQADELKNLADQIGAVLAESEKLSGSLYADAELSGMSGFGDIGADLGQAAQNIAALNAQLQNGMIDVDEYNVSLGDTLDSAMDAAGGLEGVAGVDMSAIMEQISYIVGVLSAATAQSDSLNASLANRPVATSPEAAALSEIAALGRQAAAASDYVAEQERIQSLTKDQLSLEREIASVRADTQKKGLTLSDAQVSSIAQGNIAANTSRSGGSRGGGSSSSVSDDMREAARWIDKTRTALELYEADLAEIEELNAKGFFAGHPEAYSRAIEMVEDALSDANGEASIFSDISTDIGEAILDLAGGATDAFDQLGQAIKRAALEYALFGSGGVAGFSSGISSLLGSAFGGSGGGIIGSLLGGARAGGGSVSAGVPYLVNENTPNSEVFVPSQNGAILNVPQAQKALSGSMAGGEVRVVVDVNVNDDGTLGAIARQEGAAAALPVAVRVVQQNNRNLSEQQRRPK